METDLVPDLLGPVLGICELDPELDPGPSVGRFPPSALFLMLCGQGDAFEKRKKCMHG